MSFFIRVSSILTSQYTFSHTILIKTKKERIKKSQKKTSTQHTAKTLTHKMCDSADLHPCFK